MAKLERLLALARMTKDRRVTNIREMSRVCGVSQRTIYRYLNTLQDVGLFDNLNGVERGKRAADKDALTADDRCVIRYALDHNPLAERAFFANRIERLRRFLAPVANVSGRRLRGRVLEVGLARTTPLKSRQDRWLELFERACLAGRVLKVVTSNSGDRESLLRPDALRLAGSTVQLRFRSASTGRLVRLNLDQLVSMQPGPSDPKARREAVDRRKKG